MIVPKTVIGMAIARAGPVPASWSEGKALIAFHAALARVLTDIPQARLTPSGEVLKPDQLPPVSADTVEDPLPIDSRYLPHLVEATLMYLFQSEADDLVDTARYSRHQEAYIQLLQSG